MVRFMKGLSKHNGASGINYNAKHILLSRWWIQFISSLVQMPTFSAIIMNIPLSASSLRFLGFLILFQWASPVITVRIFFLSGKLIWEF